MASQLSHTYTPPHPLDLLVFTRCASMLASMLPQPRWQHQATATALAMEMAATMVASMLPQPWCQHQATATALATEMAATMVTAWSLRSQLRTMRSKCPRLTHVTLLQTNCLQAYFTGDNQTTHYKYEVRKNDKMASPCASNWNL